MARSRTGVTASPRRGSALVTGAAQRIGAEIAIALADDGWDVAVHYGHSKPEAQTTVAAVLARGRRAVALDADLGDEAAARSLVQRAARALGPVTCLVNNASVFEPDAATDFAYDKLEHLMRLNVGAPLVLAQAMHAALPARARGVVVNLLDQKLFNLNADYLSYTLSKAALHTATDMLARALAPKLRVVGIAPGLTLPSGDQTRAEFAKAHVKTPLGASSTPSDLAAAIVYLVQARAVTGTTLIVDGGQHLVPTERDVMFVTRGRR